MKNKNKTRNKVLIALLLICYTACMVGVGAFLLDNKDTGDKPAVKQEQSEPEEKAEEKEKTPTAQLEEDLVSLVEEKHPGVTLSFYIKNLETGEEIVYNNKQLNSASMIKLFIMETVYRQVAKGEYTLTDDLKRELDLMITESNNNAANLFIDEFGGVDDTRKVTDDNIINATIRKIGYKDTQLNRKMYDTTPPGGPTGYENYTSVVEVGQLFENIYMGNVVDKATSNAMLNLLKNQKRRGKIPSLIVDKYPELTVANKTGELSQVENDAAIIMGDDLNLIFVVMINDIPKKADGSTDYALKERVQHTIGEMGLMVVDHYLEKE